MPKVRYLCVRFSNPIFPYDIPFFRSAVIEKTDRVASLFHNHKDDTAVIYRYPLIQYKVTYKKASIICLNQGADDIHHLLQHRSMELRIGKNTQNFEVEDIDLHFHQVQVWDTMFEYSLLNWMALNQKYHARFKELEGDEKAQIDLLESILKGNILSFAKGIDWFVEDRIKVEIQKIKSLKLLPFKGRKVLTFCVNFKTNVSLPDYVGLGKGSSVGFGVVKLIENEKNKLNNEI
jgi:hypothetical protein